MLTIRTSEVSGHSGQLESEDNDEDDGFDECEYPVRIQVDQTLTISSAPAPQSSFLSITLIHRVRESR